jgi:PspAA-like protein
VIVRILGEGQVDVPDGELDSLNQLDDALQNAVEGGDEEQFNQALAALLARVRAAGRSLPDEEIVPSDLVLPSSDASLAEVRELLGDEGLIPG